MRVASALQLGRGLCGVVVQGLCGRDILELDGCGSCVLWSASVCFEGGAEEVDAVSWNQSCESERTWGETASGESVGIVGGMGQER